VLGIDLTLVGGFPEDVVYSRSDLWMMRSFHYTSGYGMTLRLGLLLRSDGSIPV